MKQETTKLVRRLIRKQLAKCGENELDYLTSHIRKNIGISFPHLYKTVSYYQLKLNR